MKRWMFFAAPVTVALILGLVVYALPASGSSTSLLSRVAKLEAQSKALKATNTKLTKQVKLLNGFVNGCLIKGGAAPIMLRGNPSAGQGYEYSQDGGVTNARQTALDIPGTGETAERGRAARRSGLHLDDVREVDLEREARPAHRARGAAPPLGERGAVGALALPPPARSLSRRASRSRPRGTTSRARS